MLSAIDHRHQSLLDGINNNFNIYSDKLKNCEGIFQEQIAELESQLNMKHIPADEVVLSKQENVSNANNRNIKEKDILFCFDSNRKHLNQRKLWTLKGSDWVKCGNLESLKNIITNCPITSLKYILLNVGVNDTDNKNPDDILKLFDEIITQIREKYGNIKIILGELTPRGDEKDSIVVECNQRLNELYSTDADIFIITQGNLRDDTYSRLYDTKHIHKNAIGLYAANIKRALRKAYGITDNYSGNHQRPANCNPYDHGQGYPTWHHHYH